MSLDKDISQRMHDKYDPAMADEAKEWIEQCLGETLPNQDLMDTLKDGTILCRLLNVVTPGSTKFKVSKMPFVQMENIAKFLDGAKKLGVPAFELFQTVDLYEQKNIPQVVLGTIPIFLSLLTLAIHSFSRYASKANPSLVPLGPKLADTNPKDWDPAGLREGRNIVNTFQYGRMDGSNQGKEGIVFGGKKEIDRNYSGLPKYLDRHIG